MGISGKLDRYVPELLTRGQLEVASRRPPPQYAIFALFEVRDKYISIEALDELPSVLQSLTARPFVIIEFRDPLFQSVRADGRNQALIEGDYRCANITDALVFRIDYSHR